nr:non-reducing polyketide synthase andm [Quercus suber]
MVAKYLKSSAFNAGVAKCWSVRCARSPTFAQNDATMFAILIRLESKSKSWQLTSIAPLSGGLLQGHRKDVSAHYLRGIRKYGYAFISADYRLAPQVGIAEIFDDVKDCISFIRTELYKHVDANVLDTDRLAVSGTSAGGLLALLAGLYITPKPKVVLSIYSIMDPLGGFFMTPQPLPAGIGRIDRETVASCLDPRSGVVANSEESSDRRYLPLYMLQAANLPELLHIRPGDDTFRVPKQIYAHRLPPTYIVHGDEDGAVGVEQADETVGVMLGLGLEVDYERLHGIKHDFDRQKSVEMGRITGNQEGVLTDFKCATGSADRPRRSQCITEAILPHHKRVRDDQNRDINIHKRIGTPVGKVDESVDYASSRSGRSGKTQDVLHGCGRRKIRPQLITVWVGQHRCSVDLFIKMSSPAERPSADQASPNRTRVEIVQRALY